MTVTPNVVFLPTDPLTLAYRRRDAAEVEQLRSALQMLSRGEDIGCYTVVVRPFVGLLADAPGVGAMGNDE